MTGGSSKRFLVRVAAEKLEFGLSRLSSAGSRSVPPISHSSWTNGHLRLVLLMVKCRSTGRQVQPCKSVSNLFNSCSLTSLASLTANTEVKGRVSFPTHHKAKASYIDKTKVDGTGMFTSPREVEGGYRASI